jgi:endonuclease/exonuclease/phosphatase (EEP) superfamily protein YafD
MRPALRNLLLMVSVPGLLLARYSCTRPGPLSLLTFNIENYPRSPEQEAGAFAAIAESGAAAVAVQEITDESTFARAAQRRLGASWRFVADEGDAPLKVGLLYDADRLELLSQRTRRELVVYPGARPALEARLRARGDGGELRVVVVHLKAGGDGLPWRVLQLAALQTILAEPAGEARTIALGDFNATAQADRTALATLAAATQLRWSSRPVECTAYWSRADGCVGSALDHVLTSGPAKVTALGPCETEGCELQPRCPTFREKVSDHCPVRVELW